MELQIYGRREIAKNQDNKEKLSSTFFSLFFLKMIALTIASIIFYVFFCIDNNYVIYYRILILEIISTVLDISWLYQGLEEFKKITIRNFVIKIISVILIFTLVKDQNDLINYILIYVVTNVLGNGALWLKITKYIDFKCIKNINILKYVKPAITMLIPQIAVSIYTVLDKTMIGSLCSNVAEVGYYEQSQKIVKLSMTIITSINTVMIPRIAKNYSDGNKEAVNSYMKKTFNFIWFLAIPIMLGIIAISSKFVPWFLGEEFDKAIVLLNCTTPIILFISISSAIGSQYLMSINKQNIHTIFVIIGSILNAVTNFILIPKFFALGAAIATVLAEGFIAIAEIIYVVRTRKMTLKVIFVNWWKYLASGIVMMIIIIVTTMRLNSSIITTIIQIVLGAIIYLGILLIIKDEFTRNVIETFTNKLRKRVCKKGK